MIFFYIYLIEDLRWDKIWDHPNGPLGVFLKRKFSTRRRLVRDLILTDGLYSQTKQIVGNNHEGA